MGKLKERLRNPPFDLRLAVLDARNDEHKRELKAAKHKWRVAWALRDERCEELYDFEQSLYDDGTHDAAGIQRAVCGRGSAVRLHARRAWPEGRAALRMRV